METPLILLHGALGAADQMAPLKERLADSSPQVFLLDLPGHGTLAGDPSPYSIAGFAAAVEAFMAENRLESADFFGYSMGGYVALELTRARPGRVRRIATLGTKFDWNPQSAASMSAGLDPEKWLAKAPSFAESLMKRHSAAHWLAVVERTKAMMTALGSGDAMSFSELGEVGCPVAVMAGSLDSTAPPEEARRAAVAMPLGRFLELEGARHPFETADLGVLARLLTRFFQ